MSLVLVITISSLSSSRVHCARSFARSGVHSAALDTLASSIQSSCDLYISLHCAVSSLLRLRPRVPQHSSLGVICCTVL